MLSTVLFLCLYLLLHVHFIMCWTTASRDIQLKPDDWDTGVNNRVYEDKCVCGQDESYNLKPWSIYVFALVKEPVKHELNHLRRCIGTLINSNMVITSHKCLVEQLNQTINIYNAWINNFTLPVERFFLAREIIPAEADFFRIKEIILNTRYAYNQVKGIFPGSDVAILVLKETNVLEKMIPVCLPEYKRNLNIIYQTGYFYGVGGLSEFDITVETRKATGVPILSGPECDEEMGGVHYHLKSSNESFCIRSPALVPTTPGGPLIIGVGVSKTSEVNATAFLVGLSSRTYYRNEKQLYNYVYFTNLLDETKYIERVANVHGSKWCRPYQDAVLDLPEKSPVPKPKRYPFEYVKESKRDESLNCVCGITNSNPLKAQSRIVGGEEAIPYEFGWQIKLYMHYNLTGWHLCGGAIINDLMILTAAHCLYINASGGFSGNTLAVARAHTLEADPNQAFLPVKEIFVHPAFIFGDSHDRDIFDSDIAVVILERRLKFASGTHEGNVTKIDVRPICLPKLGQNLKVVGREAMLAGWGLIGHPNETYNPPQAEKLKKLRVPIKNVTECVRVSNGVVGENVLCYTSYNESGAQKGDSGGSLIIKEKGLWTVVGLTSWGAEGFDYDVLVEEAENPSGTIPFYEPKVNAYADVQKLLKFVEYYAQKNKARWCRSHI